MDSAHPITHILIPIMTIAQKHSFNGNICREIPKELG
jgi:hypothetical protein